MRQKQRSTEQATAQLIAQHRTTWYLYLTEVEKKTTYINAVATLEPVLTSFVILVVEALSNILEFVTI